MSETIYLIELSFGLTDRSWLKNLPPWRNSMHRWIS